MPRVDGLQGWRVNYQTPAVTAGRLCDDFCARLFTRVTFIFTHRNSESPLLPRPSLSLSLSLSLFVSLERGRMIVSFADSSPRIGFYYSEYNSRKASRLFAWLDSPFARFCTSTLSRCAFPSAKFPLELPCIAHERMSRMRGPPSCHRRSFISSGILSLLASTR